MRTIVNPFQTTKPEKILTLCILFVVASLIQMSSSTEESSVASASEENGVNGRDFSVDSGSEESHEPLPSRDGASPLLQDSNAYELKPVTDRRCFIRGVVVDGFENPVPNAELSFEYNAENKHLISDKQGRFAFKLPYYATSGETLLAEGPDGSLGFVELPDDIMPGDTIPRQQITLAPPRLLNVRVVDVEGRPASGVEVTVNTAYRTLASIKTDEEGCGMLPVHAGLRLYGVVADGGSRGVDYFRFRFGENPNSLAQNHGEEIVFTLSPTRPVTVLTTDKNGGPLPGVQVCDGWLCLPNKDGRAFFGDGGNRLTNEEGRTTLDVPIEFVEKLRISTSKIGYKRITPYYDLSPSPTGEFIIAFSTLIHVKGLVVYPDGSPASDMDIIGSWEYQEEGDERYVSASDGSFQLYAPSDRSCCFLACNEDWTSPIETRIFQLDDGSEEIVLVLDKTTTRVFGRYEPSGDDELYQGDVMVVLQWQNDMQTEHAGSSDIMQSPIRNEISSIDRHFPIHRDGSFEFHVGPGRYVIYDGTQRDWSQFTVTDQKELEFTHHTTHVLEGMVKGQIVLQSDPSQGVRDIHVVSYPEDGCRGEYYETSTDAEGNFEIQRNRFGQLVYASSEDGRLGAVARVEAEADSFELQVAPTAILTGTLLDEETGRPLPNQEVEAFLLVKCGPAPFKHYRFSPRSSCLYYRSGTTDENGRFEITEIVPGRWHYLSMWRPLDDGTNVEILDVGDALPTRAGVFELGELRPGKSVADPPSGHQTPDEMSIP